MTLLRPESVLDAADRSDVRPTRSDDPPTRAGGRAAYRSRQSHGVARVAKQVSARRSFRRSVGAAIVGMCG
jgi:hypothetical protein